MPPLAVPSGSAVGIWQDLSSNGFNATQADPSRRPRFSAAALTSPLDFNRDGRIDVLDLYAARANQTRSLTMVLL